MNKQELIGTISAKANLPKTKVNEVLNLLMDNIKNSVKKGGSVQLVGFGTWKRSKRKARTGRNPQTGETIKIKASNTVRFSAGKDFKDILN